MTFECDQEKTSVTEAELNRIRESIWLRTARAIYESLGLSSLDPDRAAAVAKLPEDVKILIRKVFRAVHFVEPGDLNRDRYLNDHQDFIKDVALYSVKLARKQVRHEDLLDEQDLAALPKLLSGNERW
jgi:hypothetical protein